jgi:hypothetical protein
MYNFKKAVIPAEFTTGIATGLRLFEGEDLKNREQCEISHEKFSLQRLKLARTERT